MLIHINKLLSKEDKVLIKVLRVQKHDAKQIMSEFLMKTAQLIPLIAVCVRFI